MGGHFESKPKPAKAALWELRRPFPRVAALARIRYYSLLPGGRRAGYSASFGFLDYNIIELDFRCRIIQKISIW